MEDIRRSARVIVPTFKQIFVLTVVYRSKGVLLVYCLWNNCYRFQLCGTRFRRYLSSGPIDLGETWAQGVSTCYQYSLYALIAKNQNVMVLTLSRNVKNAAWRSQPPLYIWTRRAEASAPVW